MSKYTLIGDYVIHEISAEKSDDMITVRIPITTESGHIKYSSDGIFEKLRTNEIYPTENGFDILILATLVYLADTRISRGKHAEDSWTREITLELPVFNLEKWTSLEGLFSRMLNFLTGDRWTIIFTKRDNILAKDRNRRTAYDAVSLFSGGMDSLIGTINHLENNHNIALISHAGDSYTKEAQKKLIDEFKKQYPFLEPNYLDLWMQFDHDVLLDGGTENTTRSRSFLFIAYGIFALSGMNGVRVLQVPENGLIALNVPLDTLRVGSHSTRTTHPFYMNLWNTVLSELGLPFSVKNPYWNKTKGEMADECLNKDFLFEVIQKSISCSSPAKLRWEKKLPFQKRIPKHCGYCVPCLIRRAAMHKAYGFDKDTTPYARKSVKELMEAHAKSRGAQLRSFQVAIKRIIDNPDLKELLIHKSGRLEGDDEFIRQISDVYYRGLLEVGSFFEDYLAFEKTALAD